MKHWCPICYESADEHQPLLQWLFGSDVICGNCRLKFEICSKDYEINNLKLHGLYMYNDFVENLLYQYKEGRDIALAKVFLAAVRKEFIDKCRHRVLIPMPSSEHKIEERGFSHLHEMLRGLDIEICDCLMKGEDYKQSLHRGKARKQIKEVMQLKSDVEIPTCELILFDDVCTSGSTLMAAYDLLHNLNENISAEVLCIHPHFVEMCDEKKL